ncbi:probable arginine--tRNA ligase, mitochondrial [Oppia nitens]|uniref:probable arginine--tRNA ligase, mitochondrial n=1 Tax=Oppia nitens TaxID=1686743 RepID=UPI0023DA4EC0|nr:probable arginine--tRNA ligase, mitochondrial [Oppia nitens]
MVLRLKQLICNQLRQQYQLNGHKSVVKTFLSLDNNNNDIGMRPKFSIDLNQLVDNTTTTTTAIIDDKHVKNLLSKLSFVRHLETKRTDLLTAEDSVDGVSKDRSSSTTTDHKMIIEVDEQVYVKQLFHDLVDDNLRENLGNNTRGGQSAPVQTVVVEFSSPNIAKPFHVGNYRSTIIGNFVSNFYRFCRHNVISLNYLGDFGTQFGILSLAYDSFGNDNQLASNPSKHLFDVYVKGNAECKASDQWRQSAKNRFNELETKQNPDVLKQWQRFRETSVDQLKSLYSRLGIAFDDFHSESMYSEAGHRVVDQLRQLGLIDSDDQSAAQFALIADDDDTNRVNLKIPVIKSDGSTLYLTRDIAAVLHRKQLFNFDKMLYIVDSSQSKHFNHLFKILTQYNHEFQKKLIHLRFGRIIGMSTRRGDIIFLEDVLNEAKERAIESCKTSPNTKISEENYDSVSDILGMSGLLIHDLAHRRVQEYRFKWDKALKHTGDTGIALQYTHSRLCSLEKNCGIELNTSSIEPHMDCLSPIEAKLLMTILSQFDDILVDSFDTLEPSLLVHYLFDLKNAINRAIQVLKVKGQEPDVAQTRLLLFRCSRNVLNQGMQILGLSPLSSM